MEALSKTELWDVFISHASEDKARVALAIAAELPASRFQSVARRP